MAEVKHSPDRTEEVSILKTWIDKSQKIPEQCNEEMEMYTFPAKKISVSDYQKVTRENLKKIIMVGETGSGKSTLINAFVNYAAGIEMKDDLRFKLVNPKNESPTKEISRYLIEGTFLEYPIIIWDTPGFGDRDEMIKQQLDDLFKIVDEFHAICFVINASVHRLTETQRIIIDSIQQLFERKAKMNTYVLARFGDEDCPEVISESMKSNFSFDENRFFAFNNADLFKSESERRSDPKQYWDITINSIIRFYNTLAHQLPFEITTETRKAIEDRVNLQMTTNARTSLNLKKLEAVKGPTKKITTYCTVCKCICHKNCNQPCSDKRRCWAMMTNGYCRICPNRCKWNLHECGPDM